VHVRNTVHDRINLSSEGVSVLKSTLTSTDFNFPGRIEEISTREDDVGMVQDEDRCHSHQAEEGVSNEGRQFTKSGGKAQISLTPSDGMIPDLQRTFTLDLANNSV